MPTRRLSRAAILAFTAASLGAACGGKDTDSTSGRQGEPSQGGAGGALGDGGGGAFNEIPVNSGTPIYGAPFGGFVGAGGAPR